MNFRKPKQDVINEAFFAAQTELNNKFYQLKNNYVDNSTTTNLDCIQSAVAMSIEAAIRSLVENTYTDQEFEEDLTLNT